MTNKQRQTELDKEKYVESEKQNCDMSGKMPYCDFCACVSNNSNCSATQTERENGCICAKAWNKMRKAK